jgi:hypothetical protein
MSRWQILASGSDIYRLDGWTDDIVVCNTGGQFAQGSKFICDQK